MKKKYFPLVCQCNEDNIPDWDSKSYFTVMGKEMDWRISEEYSGAHCGT